jgi:predicted outer membrane protein
MSSNAFLIIALTTVAFIGCDRNRASDNARADSAVGTSGQSDRNRVTGSDKSFVRDMAIANMAEIELATLAPERTKDNEVKKFAQLMIDDHTKNLNSLQAIAAQHNIPVPTQLDARHARQRDKIAKWHGNEFERAFMDAAVDAHEDMLDELESRVDETRLAEYNAQMNDIVTGQKKVERAEVIAILPENSDNGVTMRLNQWAAAVYPVVRAHLEAAKVLKVAVEKRPRTTN